MSTQNIDREMAKAIAQELSNMNNHQWYDTLGASEYLCCSNATLKTWRAKGAGPKYHVIQGKMVRYHVDDLNAFVGREVNDD